MKHRTKLLCSRLFSILIVGTALSLQSPVMEAAATRQPKASAELLTTKPVLDGEIRGDAAWGKVTPLQEFWQIRPEIGEPASQDTDVYIGYTNDTLYIGVILHDSDPDKIIVADSRRDADLKETDSFTMIIDSFLDQQNGFVFGTNPAGIEYDAQVTPHLVAASGLAIRVQGLNRYYAFLLTAPGELRLIKRIHHESCLARLSFDWQFGNQYALWLRCDGPNLTAGINEQTLFEVTDHDLDAGGIGLVIEEGRCAFEAVSAKSDS